LDINVRDDQVVGLERESLSYFTVIVLTKDGSSDEFSRVLVEVIESSLGDTSSNSRSDGLAEITNEVRDGKHGSGLGLFVVVSWYIEVPVVGELQAETSVVSGFYYHNISGETWS